MTPPFKIDGIDGTPDVSPRERLATYAHDAWSGWMKYLFDRSFLMAGDHVRIPSELVARWARQMNTPYADLPEDEKASDRVEADKMLAICGPMRWEELWRTAAQSVTRLYWQNENLKRAYLLVMQERDVAEANRDAAIAARDAERAERDTLRQRLDEHIIAEHLRGLMSHDEYTAAMIVLEAAMDSDGAATVDDLALFARVEAYEDYHFPIVEPTPEQAAAFRVEQTGRFT